MFAWALAIAAAFFLGGIWAWRGPIRSSRRTADYARARSEFHRNREHLEARFCQLAASSGKPRGLRWTNCDFENDVTYARDRRTDGLSAFVAVTVAFEAIVGGPMEDVEAVGNLRAATAVFGWHNHHWQTEGRVVFNLNPEETVAHFRDALVPVKVDVR